MGGGLEALMAQQLTSKHAVHAALAFMVLFEDSEFTALCIKPQTPKVFSQTLRDHFGNEGDG